MRTIDRILNLIKQKNLSEYRVIKDCSLQTNTFTYWKSGRATPNLDTMVKLADYFNVSLDYLVGRENQKQTGTETSKPSKNTALDATTATLLNKWERLTQIQQEKALSYIDAMIDDTPDFIKGEMVGRQNANRRKNNPSNIETRF